ncbi:MAG TPA: restriction endonuclease subunit S [Candidatus Acidoferrales bacterium]|nr:restriction endonuclease subunit S [Candidatus Acidoferrales bacterium]
MAGETRLGEVADIIMGQSPPGDTYNQRGEGLPFFQGVADFNYRHPTPRVFCSAPSRIALPGDILLSVRAPIGRVNVADRKCAIGRGLSIIRPKRQEDGRYLEFALRMQQPNWTTIEGSGSVFGNATRRDLEELVVPWPQGASERRAIAHILGTLDDKIELNRRMTETLEAMARALFKSWFVDFDPVRAKAEGRDPGLPQPLVDLFPARLVDSELGEIPEGWEAGALGDVAGHPRRGVQPNSMEPDTPYIALEHMPKRCIALSDWGVADGLASNKFEFRKGEILFGKLRPYFHKVGVAPVDGVCSTDIVVVASKSADWFGLVLGHVSSTEFVEYTNAGSTGTKMPRTSWYDMARYQIVLPPQPVVRAFNDLVRPLIDRIIGSIHQSRTLAALRDALLPRLISGELRVKDAEMFLKEREL